MRASDSSFSSTTSKCDGARCFFRFTERFTRTDEDTLMYEYTVNDPQTWTIDLPAVWRPTQPQLELWRAFYRDWDTLDCVVAPGDLIAAARAQARSFIDNTAPVSVALIRRMMWRMLGASHPMEAHRADSRAIYEMGRSADA